MNFIVLETFDNYIDANLVLGRMQQAGIHCWLKDENTVTIDPILTNAIGGIKLMVSTDDMQNATEVLQILKEIKRKSYACPNCGSHNIEYINTSQKAINWVSSLLTWLLGSYAIGIKKIWHCFNCGKEFNEPVSLNDLYLSEENNN